MLRRVPSRDGIRIESKKQWLFVSIGGDIYRVLISLGNFSISIQRSMEEVTKRLVTRASIKRASRVSAEEVFSSGMCKHGRLMTVECRHCWTIREGDLYTEPPIGAHPAIVDADDLAIVKFPKPTKRRTTPRHICESECATHQYHSWDGEPLNYDGSPFYGG